jgi:PAS domain-containing protein
MERSAAWEALKESEEKYRNVVERANDGIAIIQDEIVKFVAHRVGVWVN